jgi:hypothetical protein
LTATNEIGAGFSRCRGREIPMTPDIFEVVSRRRRCKAQLF